MATKKTTAKKPAAKKATAKAPAKRAKKSSGLRLQTNESYSSLTLALVLAWIVLIVVFLGLVILKLY